MIGATLTPYGGAEYYSDIGEKIREAVNDWIRTSGTFDGVADFDKATRDAQNLNRFNPAYDSGDHLHPNDAGYKAMAQQLTWRCLICLPAANDKALCADVIRNKRAGLCGNVLTFLIETSEWRIFPRVRMDVRIKV